MPFCTANHSATERSGPSPISSNFDGTCLRTRSKISITSETRFTGRKFERCTSKPLFLGRIFEAKFRGILGSAIHVAIDRVVDDFNFLPYIENPQGAVAEIVGDGGDAIALVNGVAGDGQGRSGRVLPE